MPTTDVIVLEKKMRNAGTYTMASRVVPTGVSAISLAIDRAELAETVQIAWACDLSFDAGATWSPWGGATTVGGVLTDPQTGTPLTPSAYMVPLPDPQNANRRLRGSLTLSERSSINLTLTLVTP